MASDSELLVKQMRGEYKVKNEGLRPLHAEARERAALSAVSAIRHVTGKKTPGPTHWSTSALDEQRKGWSIIHQPPGASGGCSSVG